MENVNLKSHVIKYGLILGAIGIIITFLIYIVDITLMTQWWLGLLMLAINIGIIVYAGIDLRKNNGGYLSFKNAFLSTFLIFLVAGIIGTLVNLLMFYVIDPELPGRLTDATVETTASMMQKFGASQEQIDLEIEKVKQREPYSAKSTLMGFGIGIIIYAILALIIGAIIKRKRPDFV